MGLTGHQPCWKTASSGFTEKKIRQTHRRKCLSSSLASTHMCTHVQIPYMFLTIHTKGHKAKCAKVSTGVSAPLPPGPMCHHRIPVSLLILGPPWVFLQPLLPALAVPHPAQGSVPASVVPLVNGIVVGGTCLTLLWEAGVFDTGNEVSSGLASEKCPQCSLLWEASHTAAHGTNCPLVLDFHILESPFISLRL